MSAFTGKNIVVIGGSRGVGRQVVKAAARGGGRVLAVAREQGPLDALKRDMPGVGILALNASDERAPALVFEVFQPDVMVLSAGAFPPAAPLHEQTWAEFAVNWEADVKIAFHFIKAALSLPLAAGSSVVLVSSGAALGGSPISGGYAGAKRTQIFIASYAQKESDRLGLGLRFVTLAPRIMPDSDLGRHAVAGYSRYLGMSEADFVRSMGSAPAPSDVARAAIELAMTAEQHKGKLFVVSGKGLESVTG